MNSLNDLALIAIGIGFGLCLAAVAGMVYVLERAAQRMSRSAERMIALAQHSEGVIDRLRSDMINALSRLDAERLYSASINLQRLVKSLAIQVDTMQRALFTQPPAPALDFTPAGMGLDEEAEDDARMLADRARWQSAGQPQPAKQSPLDPLADPLAGLTEEEKRIRVHQFFERRRQEQAAAATGATGGATIGSYAAGNPYPPGFVPSSTPPAAGAGIYSSLLDEAVRGPQPSTQPPADFSGLEPEAGVELDDKGELG